jgi:hypothetical protein
MAVETLDHLGADKEMERPMFKQFGLGSTNTSPDRLLDGASVAHSGRLAALIALENIGARRSIARDAEIYAEGDPGDYWYCWPTEGATSSNSASPEIASGWAMSESTASRQRRSTTSS